MKLIDKILLGLLIVILPVGIYLASKYGGQSNLVSNSTIDPIQQAKLEKLVQDLSGLKPQAGGVEKKPFQITSVIFASNSGTLTVSGIAPYGSELIEYDLAIVPDEVGVPELGGVNDEVTSALNLDRKIVKPRNDGSFVIKLMPDKQTGLLWLKLNQTESVEVIKYDLSNGKQI